MSGERDGSERSGFPSLCGVCGDRRRRSAGPSRTAVPDAFRARRRLNEPVRMNLMFRPTDRAAVSTRLVRTRTIARIMALASMPLLGSVPHLAAASGGTLSLCPNGGLGGTGRLWNHLGTSASSLCGGYYSFALSNGEGTVGSNGSLQSSALVQGFKDGRLLLRGEAGIAVEGRARFDSIASFGNNRITDLAAGTAGTDAVNLDQLNKAVSAIAAPSPYVKINSTGQAASAGVAGSIAIGEGAATRAGGVRASVNSIAMGTQASAAGIGSISVGANASNAGSASVAIGDSAFSQRGVALGAHANGSGNLSSALGHSSRATGVSSVALGTYSVANRGNAVSIGSDATDGSGFTRQLFNLSAGTLSASSTDAVNGAQLFATNERVRGLENAPGLVTFNAAQGKVEVAKALAGDQVDLRGTAGARRLTGLANGLKDDEAVTIAQLRAAGVLDPAGGSILTVLTYDNDSLATATLGGTRGTVIGNLAAGRVAAGSLQAINGGQLYQALSESVKLIGGGASLGLLGTFTAPGFTVQSKTYSDVGSALGALDARLTEVDRRMAANARGRSLGAASFPAGPSQADPGIAAPAPAETLPVLGAGAVASGVDATAVGDRAVASAANSVALGAGSVADRANSVSVGSVGAERQITHVADGTEATDAVNKGQLDRGIASANAYTDGRVQALDDSFEALRGDVDQRLRGMDRRIDRQGAMGTAMLTMATSAAGVRTDNRVGVGVGFQGGESALSLGYQRAISERATLTVGGAFSGDDRSIGLGGGFGW